LGYRCFQIGWVFVEYDLFNTTSLIKNLTYIHFGIILTQFYINFSRQEHQIELSYVSINSWDSQVSGITPFHLSYTVPLKTYVQVIQGYPLQDETAKTTGTSSNMMFHSLNQVFCFKYSILMDYLINWKRKKNKFNAVVNHEF